MKKMIILIVLPLLVSGCLLERVAPLQPVPSLSRFWSKPGMTEESWLENWISCGGARDGGVNDFPRLPGETLKAQHGRTWNTLDRCMLNKGYRFTGDCTQEWNKRRPGCGGP